MTDQSGHNAKYADAFYNAGYIHLNTTQKYYGKVKSVDLKRAKAR